MPFDPVPPGRKVHYLRIYGTNKNGDVVPDIWVDMERIDEWRTTTKEHGQWQEVVFKLRWFDEPGHSDPPSSRKTRIVKYWDVTAWGPNEEDAEEWVPIDVVTHFEARQSGNDVAFNLLSKALTDFRIRERRRWVHYDTSIDDAASKALEADPTQKTYYAVAEDYQKIEDSRDPGQWVETEIVLKHLDRASGKTGMMIDDKALAIAITSSAGTDQDLRLQFNNTYLINNSEDSQLSGDVPPERRIDPFQNIVNTQVSQPQAAALGMKTPPGNSDDSSTTQTSKDGLTWDDGFGTSSNAASGLGFTVVCSGDKFIAFGKPQDGAACFIAAKGKTIERGVSNSRGDGLDWTAVKTLDATLDGFDGIKSCSFAGGGFFVSYIGDDADTSTYLAVSFDGVSFTIVNPFNGVVAASTGSSATGIRGTADPTGSANPIGGNVAYDKKNQVYVTTGTYSRNYVGLESIGAGEFVTIQLTDENFMSSVSTDGLHWTPKFDTSEGSGFDKTIDGSSSIGGAQNGGSTVCFGNGMFVAASGFKISYPFYGSPTFVVFNKVNTACSVATSPDGKNWTNRRLPGSVSTPYVYGEHADSGGLGQAVGFFKTPPNKSGVGGFFVAVGFESGFTFAQSKIWQSEDGAKWSLIRTDSGQFDWILSAINKSPGKVVTH